MRDFLRGAGYLLRGYKLLRLPGIKRYIIIPVLLSFLLSVTSMVGTGLLIDHALDSLTPPNWTWLRWVLWPLLFIALFGFMVVAAGLFINIIAAPFNSELTRKLATSLAANKNNIYPGQGTLTEAITIFRSESQRLLSHVVWLLALGGMALLPGGSLPASLLGWLFGAWMLGLQYLDYPLGLLGLSFNAQRQIAQQRRSLVLGFGVAVALLHSIPVLNFMAVPVAVAGATALWHERLRPLGADRTAQNKRNVL